MKSVSGNELISPLLVSISSPLIPLRLKSNESQGMKENGDSTSLRQCNLSLSLSPSGLTLILQPLRCDYNGNLISVNLLATKLIELSETREGQTRPR